MVYELGWLPSNIFFRLKRNMKKAKEEFTALYGIGNDIFTFMSQSCRKNIYGFHFRTKEKICTLNGWKSDCKLICEQRARMK